MRLGGPVVPLVSIRTATRGWNVLPALPVETCGAVSRSEIDTVDGPAGTSAARSSGSPTTNGRSSAAMSARWVDGDDGATAKQHAEKRRHMGRSITQQHADLRLAGHGGNPIRHLCDLAP